MMVVKKMEKEEYAVACTEILEVLNYVSKEDYNKVPKDVLQVLEKNKKDDIVFLYNPWKDINEQKMSETGRVMLASFFRDYWSTTEQREKIKKFQSNKRNIIEEEKQQRYDSKNLFKTQIATNEKLEKSPEKTSIIVYNENIFSKILNKIKNLFKRNKE